jgi:FecR-like protein
MKQNELDLLHRYLDVAITPDELDSLEDLLRNSAEARATLRSLATIDAKWQQLAADEAVVMPDAREVAPRRSRRLISKWMTLGAIAASLLVGALGWLRAPKERAVEIERGIARVIRIEGEGKAGQDRVVVDGAELFSGEELAMQQGSIELAFRETGVHIVATAPLRIKLDSDRRVSLHEGQVKLVVPPQGVGFVVDTAGREFVDLGTSFVVTASPEGSEVLVLDGQIAVGQHAGESEELMREGEFAKFDRNGKLKTRSKNRLSRTVPELSLPVTKLDSSSLRGTILGYGVPPAIPKIALYDDLIGQKLLPLIRSEFHDQACLGELKQGEAISFRGIAGAYHELPDRTGLAPYSRECGWMAWYRGNVIPPRPGRYRFWGYADNHLLVAIDGKSVFEGSRNNSSFKKLGIPRADNPALPCLIARAGFARGQWIELSGNPVRLDILFGEVSGNITSGLLLVEREGDTYEETFWGQPQWPLFLTETPGEDEIAEFERLVNHLEEKMMGAFSIAENAVWKVAQ